MKVGFWNVNKNKNIEHLVCDFAINHEIDLLILLECTIDPADLLASLNLNSVLYHYYSPIASNFVRIFSRFSTRYLRDVRDEHRISAKEFLSPLDIRLNLILLHFPSRLYFDESDQDAHSQEIKNFIESVEAETKNDKTLVIGDFNMNPFQRGMIQTTGLHSTFAKNIATKQSRQVQNKQYKFFYNPMWSFFGERGKGSANGTYFYSTSKPTCYFWNIFDQVLIRPSLLDGIFNEDSLNIVTSIASRSLLNIEGFIDSSVSDHLPIEFELNKL